MKWLIKFLVTGFFSGKSPIMPGTAGSLVAAALIWLYPLNWWQIVLICMFSVFLCGQAEKLYGETDPGQVVLDEFCGMFVATWQLESLSWIFLAFVLFRIFDIGKPFLIRRVQELPDGWGVVLDDLLAGLAARAIIALIMLVL